MQRYVCDVRQFYLIIIMKTAASVCIFIALCLMFCARELLAGEDAACPNIVSRKDWNAKSPKLTINFTEIPEFVVIHHTATASCNDRKSCISKVKSFQEYHMKKISWDDIAYNFLIGGEGNVYLGRGWDFTGGHTHRFQDRSIGISFIGHFTSTTPNQVALDAAKQLIACGVSKGKIEARYSLVGARQLQPTESPGDGLYRLIKTWPHWVQEPITTRQSQKGYETPRRRGHDKIPACS